MERFSRWPTRRGISRLILSERRLLPLVLVAVLATGSDVSADTETDAGIWGVVTATGSAAAVSPTLGEFHWWLEGQVRFRDEGGSDFDEHRIWQQLSWSTRLDPVTASTRTRLEQRFVETGDDTGWRFRQRVALTYPLSRSSTAAVGMSTHQGSGCRSINWSSLRRRTFPYHAREGLGDHTLAESLTGSALACFWQSPVHKVVLAENLSPLV